MVIAPAVWSPRNAPFLVEARAGLAPPELLPHRQSRARPVSSSSGHRALSASPIPDSQAASSLLRCASRAPAWRPLLFLGSSVVERSAVNRLVGGSNPSRGAIPPLFPH